MESPHPGRSDGIRRADSPFPSIYLAGCALVKGCFFPPQIEEGNVPD